MEISLQTSSDLLLHLFL